MHQHIFRSAFPDNVKQFQYQNAILPGTNAFAVHLGDITRATSQIASWVQLINGLTSYETMKLLRTRRGPF